MRVAINGAGVAGPTVAYWLRRYGHEPVLFERAPALRTGGYLIDFWGLGYQVAERMGLEAEILRLGYQFEELRIVDERGERVTGMGISGVREQAGGRFTTIARGDLAAAIFEADCRGVEAHFGVSVRDVREARGGVDVWLTDGSLQRFDLVIGADGLHSHVRSLMFGDDAQQEHPLGCHVAAFSVAGYPHRDELSYVSHSTVKRQAARVSLRDDRTIFLLTFRSELLEGASIHEHPRELLRRVFSGMAWRCPRSSKRWIAPPTSTWTA